MRTLILALVLLSGGCTAIPPAGTFNQPPIGFSTYSRTLDGQRVRLWTDTLTGTTTGTIDGKSIRLKGY